MYLGIRRCIREGGSRYWLREMCLGRWCHFIVLGLLKKETLAIGPRFGISSVLKLGDSLEKVLELISQNEKITAAEIVEKIKMSLRAVEKQLANLKSMGIIKRVGSRKSGRWKILVDN